MNRGYILLFKKMVDWQWYSDLPTFRLFVHLLLKANHESKPWLNFDIKRGQLVTSLDSLTLQTGLSVQQIRTAMNKLKSTGDITIIPNTKFTIITIPNYSNYQDSNKQGNKPSTNHQQTNNKPSTNHQQQLKEGKEDKESKEVKEKNKHPTLFDNLPTWIPKSDWEDFVEMRKRKTPLTDAAAKLIFNRLNELRQLGNDVGKILQQSTMSGWTGVFPLKPDFKTKHAKPSKLAQTNVHDIPKEEREKNRIIFNDTAKN